MKRVGLAAVAALLLAASSAQAATPSIDIHSAGPLSDIYIGNDLSCQVRSGGFSSTEFFPNATGPGDCGTFLFITGPTPRLRSSWVPTSRTTLAALTPSNLHRGAVHAREPVADRLGHGGESVPRHDRRDRHDPREVSTSLSSEVDTYVVGNNFFHTRRDGHEHEHVERASTATLYHAADCQLRGNVTTGLARPSHRSELTELGELARRTS